MNATVRRVHVDISYTRTQSGSVGVTRTVRRLLQELLEVARLGDGLQILPVAIHSTGYRQAGLNAIDRGPGESMPKGIAANLLGRIVQTRLRRWVLALLPLGAQTLLWRHVCKWSFDAASHEHPPSEFAAGDILFVADAAWHYAPWRAADHARHQGARVVLLVYDLIPLSHPQFCDPLVRVVFADWLERMLVRSDGVLCISEATRSELLDYCRAAGWAMPRTAVIRLGCDPAAGVPSSAPVRPALSAFLQQSGPCYATVGTVEPRKNHDWLLGVFERLWASGVSYRLVLAGRPSAACQDLVERLRRHPMQGRLLMYVPDATDAEIETIYAQARALVLPSMAEGFGLPLVEARTRGCPVIASDLPAFRELADAGVSLYPPGSAEGLRAKLKAYAEQPARDHHPPMPAFSWRDSAVQCLTAMRQVLET